MAINLVSLVSQFLTPQLVGSLARALWASTTRWRRSSWRGGPDDPRRAWHGSGRAWRRAEGLRRGL